MSVTILGKNFTLVWFLSNLQLSTAAFFFTKKKKGGF